MQCTILLSMLVANPWGVGGHFQPLSISLFIKETLLAPLLWGKGRQNSLLSLRMLCKEESHLQIRFQKAALNQLFPHRQLR